MDFINYDTNTHLSELTPSYGGYNERKLREIKNRQALRNK